MTTPRCQHVSTFNRCAPAPLLPEIEHAICSAEQADPEPLSPLTAYRLAAVVAWMRATAQEMASASARAFRSSMYAAGVREPRAYRTSESRRRAAQVAEARKWGFA